MPAFLPTGPNQAAGSHSSGISPRRRPGRWHDWAGTHGPGDKDGFMGEVREGLGEMASPADLGQALAAIGLFRAAPGEADLAGELKRLGSTELLRLEMANWLLGAASMQVLMATGAADDAGVDPVAINRAAARMLSGADCEHDDELKTAFARLLARQLESLLMVLTAEQQGTLWAAPADPAVDGRRRPPAGAARSRVRVPGRHPR
jgi:hypothetical protein